MAKGHRCHRPGPLAAVVNDAKAGLHGALKPALRGGGAPREKRGLLGYLPRSQFLSPKSRSSQLLAPSFPSLTWGFPHLSEATHAQLPLPTPPIGLGIWNIHIYLSLAARIVRSRYSYRLDFVARLVRAARLHGLVVVLSLAQGAVGPIVVRQTTETAAVRPLLFTLALLV